MKTREFATPQTWQHRSWGRTGHHSHLPILRLHLDGVVPICREPTVPVSLLAPALGEAIGAVDRAPVTGLEWHLARFAARSADCIVHLSRLPLAPATGAVAVPLSANRPAVWTATGLIGEALAGKELLLGGAESELVAAIRANESLIAVLLSLIHI